MSRYEFQGDETRYMSTSGSDSNDGTQAAPWASNTGAWKWLQRNCDLRGHNVTVQMAQGTYPGSTLEGAILGARRIDSVTFCGDPVHCNTVVIANTSGHGILVADDATVKFDGVMFSGVGTQSANDLCVCEGRVSLGTVAFSGCSWAHMQAVGPRSRIAMTAQYYYILGGGTFHVLAEQGAFITLNATLNSLNAGYGFTTFAHADQGAIIDFTGFSQIGPEISGKRFTLESGGIISVNKLPLNYLPGNIAGTGNGPDNGRYV